MSITAMEEDSKEGSTAGNTATPVATVVTVATTANSTTSMTETSITVASGTTESDDVKIEEPTISRTETTTVSATVDASKSNEAKSSSSSSSAGSSGKSESTKKSKLLISEGSGLNVFATPFKPPSKSESPSKRSSSSSSSSSTSRSVKKGPLKWDNEKILESMIRSQIEYFFTDYHLANDTYLVARLNEDPGHWIPIKLLASSPRIRSLTNRELRVVSALKASSYLEVSSDSARVRRPNCDLPKPRPQKDLRRTVFVFGIPEKKNNKTTLQSLMKEFGVIKAMHFESDHAGNPESPDPSVSSLITNRKFTMYTDPTSATLSATVADASGSSLKSESEATAAKVSKDPEKKDDSTTEKSTAAMTPAMVRTLFAHPFPNPNGDAADFSHLRSCFVVFGSQSQATKCVKARGKAVDGIRAMHKYDYVKIEKRYLTAKLKGETLSLSPTQTPLIGSANFDLESAPFAGKLSLSGVPPPSSGLSRAVTEIGTAATAAAPSTSGASGSGAPSPSRRSTEVSRVAGMVSGPGGSISGRDVFIGGPNNFHRSALGGSVRRMDDRPARDRRGGGGVGPSGPFRRRPHVWRAPMRPRPGMDDLHINSDTALLPPPPPIHRSHSEYMSQHRTGHHTTVYRSNPGHWHHHHQQHTERAPHRPEPMLDAETIGLDRRRTVGDVRHRSFRDHPSYSSASDIPPGVLTPTFGPQTGGHFGALDDGVSLDSTGNSFDYYGSALGMPPTHRDYPNPDSDYYPTAMYGDSDLSPVASGWRSRIAAPRTPRGLDGFGEKVSVTKSEISRVSSALDAKPYVPSGSTPKRSAVDPATTALSVMTPPTAALSPTSDVIPAGPVVSTVTVTPAPVSTTASQS